jgi:hypothetical protein
MGKEKFQFSTDAVRIGITASSVENTTLIVGRVYRVTAMGGNALIEDSTDAASTSNYAFAVANGDSILWKCNSAIINVIENDTTSDGAAAVSFELVDEEYD